MNLLKTIREMGKDILKLKQAQAEAQETLTTVATKVTSSELDTDWIDIKTLLESGGAWKNVEGAYIRRIGNTVLFEIHAATLSATRSHQPFRIGNGFSTPWQSFRATTGSQPPEVLLFMNRLHWIGFTIDGVSQVSCRLTWVTTDPFPEQYMPK